MKNKVEIQERMLKASIFSIIDSYAINGANVNETETIINEIESFRIACHESALKELQIKCPECGAEIQHGFSDEANELINKSRLFNKNQDDEKTDDCCKANH